MFKAELYNATAWAEIFKASGANYVVLTSKHHGMRRRGVALVARIRFVVFAPQRAGRTGRTRRGEIGVAGMEGRSEVGLTLLPNYYQLELELGRWQTAAVGGSFTTPLSRSTTAPTLIWSRHWAMLCVPRVFTSATTFRSLSVSRQMSSSRHVSKTLLSCRVQPAVLAG